jgi:hypothetical protein
VVLGFLGITAAGPWARAADYSAPEDVYELRARDPQQPLEQPRRLLFPRWQEDRRASVYGWVDCGIGGNTQGSDFNGTVGLQDRNLQAMMNQLYLVGERRLDVDTDAWDWGARVDLLYGTDAWQTNARGLDAYLFNQFDNFGIPRWESSRYYSLAMPQLYGEVGRGDLSVLLGHFYTPLGYEVVPAVGNFFYTHSYAFMFGTPNTHTGVLVNWEPNDGLRVTSGVTNGWDNFTDGMPAFSNPDYPGASNNVAYLGELVLTSADGGQLLAIAASTGNEYTPVIEPTAAPGTLLVGNRSMVTAYWQNELAEQLTSVTEGWSAWQFNADTGFENVGQQAGLAQWYGICQYFYRGLTDQLSAGTRLEWFRDNNGYRAAGHDSGRSRHGRRLRPVVSRLRRDPAVLKRIGRPMALRQASAEQRGPHVTGLITWIWFMGVKRLVSGHFCRGRISFATRGRPWPAGRRVWCSTTCSPCGGQARPRRDCASPPRRCR